MPVPKSSAARDVPEVIAGSSLWRRLSGHVELQVGMLNLRGVASRIATKISVVIPWLTEHSVEAHMDRLWAVADQVFTPEEISRFSPGEAFVLGCSFYVHDLGYAFAVTEEGRKTLRENAKFKAVYERLRVVDGVSDEKAGQVALQLVSHVVHAQNAEHMVNQPLPGLDGLYLLESTDLRNKWSRYIGQVSASHHWSLREVDKKLGCRGALPDPLGGSIDLGFLACAIRVIDCAHINSDRASCLEQLLRGPINDKSLLHWKAQEHINGPRRKDDQLVFASSQPIKSMDAWWLFHEMASTLENEIRSVRDYLLRRTETEGRFSLLGVKSVRDAEEFARLVEPDGFDPVDIRIHPHSVERLVELLGGRTLYGDDRFAPIRELLQNARDAILLQEAADKVAGVRSQPGEIDLSIEKEGSDTVLVVRDNGVGMTKSVISEYLLGIASDYWKSGDFYSDYPGVAKAGFGPAGRFGIGFLSVFMIGDKVEVRTQRRGGEALALTLYGVGRRGAMTAQSGGPKTGTTVRVRINQNQPWECKDLTAMVRAKAPMLTLPVSVSEKDSTTRVEPAWWRYLSQDELHRFVIEQPASATDPAGAGEQHDWLGRHRRAQLRENQEPFSTWFKEAPELVDGSKRILALPWAQGLVLCSSGLAVRYSDKVGFVGLADIGPVELDVARSTPVDWDEEAFRASIRQGLRPGVICALDALGAEGRVPDRFEFLLKAGVAYGDDVLTETNLPWMTLIEPPGSAILLRPAELRSGLAKHNELFVAYSTQPWSATAVCFRHFPDAPCGTLVLPVSRAGGPRVSTDWRSDETITTHLSAHFRHEGLPPGAALLNATLRVIAEAWDVTLQDLVMMDWRRREDNETICGYLVR